MEDLFVFSISFVAVFIFLLVNYFIRRSRNELSDSRELLFLTQRFKLKKEKLNYKALGLIFVLVNSLIIASIGTIASALKIKYIWQLLIGFVLLMISIYSIYGLIGLILKRKEK